MSAAAASARSDAPTRHLQPVDGRPKRRHAETYTPVFDDVMSLRSLKHGPKNMYCRIVRYQGRPEDGRPGTREPIYVSQARLAQALGATIDEIHAWGERLGQHHPCQACGWAHALLRIKRVGKRRYNEYSIVRCADVSARDRSPIVERPKRDVVRPIDRERQAQTAFDLTSDSEKVRITEPSSSGDPAPVEPRLAILRGIASLEGYDVDDAVLAVLAAHIAEVGGGAAELEALLVRLIVARALSSPADAERAIAAFEPTRDSEKVRITDAPIAGAANVADRIYALGERAGHTQPRARTSRAAAAQIAQLLVAAAASRSPDAGAAATLVDRVLSDPRLTSAPNPVAVLRIGVTDGWLLEPADRVDARAKYAKAFERLVPGDREIAEQAIRDHLAGKPLDYRRLDRHGVSSRGMIDYLISRFR